MKYGRTILFILLVIPLSAFFIVSIGAGVDRGYFWHSMKWIDVLKWTSFAVFLFFVAVILVLDKLSRGKFIKNNITANRVTFFFLVMGWAGPILLLYLTSNKEKLIPVKLLNFRPQVSEVEFVKVSGFEIAETEIRLFARSKVYGPVVANYHLLERADVNSQLCLKIQSGYFGFLVVGFEKIEMCETN